MIRNLFRIVFLIPIGYWLYMIFFGDLGVEPAKSLNHMMGETALYLILLNLLIGILIDFRLKWPNWLRPLLTLRRYLGVLAFFILCGHIFMYFVLESFEKQAIEQLFTKVYLIFGGLAFWIIFLLAVTSNDWSVRRFTIKKWKKLHRLVYLASVFFGAHILLIEKADLIKYGLILGLLLIVQLIRWGRRLYERST